MKHIYKWLFLSVAIFSVAASYAQSQRVALPASRMEIGQAIQSVEQQTGLIFSYNVQLLDTSSVVVFPTTELSLEQAMTRMLAGKDLNFMFRGKYVIVYPDFGKKPVPPVVHPRTSDVYEPTPVNSREAAHLPRPAKEPEPILPAESPAPDTSSFYSDYTGLDRFSFGGKHLPSFAVKSNILYAAGTFTPNLALEAGLGKKFSIALSGSYNPWNRIGTIENNDKLVHWVVSPELRYWFCEPFNGHFVSVNPFYNQFNVSGHNVPFVGFGKAMRYEGFAVGGGVNYGYTLPIAPRWNVEFEVGVGVAWMKYDTFDCTLCSGVLKKKQKTYFGPTKFAINLVFLIR